MSDVEILSYKRVMCDGMGSVYRDDFSACFPPGPKPASHYRIPVALADGRSPLINAHPISDIALTSNAESSAGSCCYASIGQRLQKARGWMFRFALRA